MVICDDRTCSMRRCCGRGGWRCRSRLGSQMRRAACRSSRCAAALQHATEAASASCPAERHALLLSSILLHDSVILADPHQQIADEHVHESRRQPPGAGRCGGPQSAQCTRTASSSHCIDTYCEVHTAIVVRKRHQPFQHHKCTHLLWRSADEELQRRRAGGPRQGGVFLRAEPTDRRVRPVEAHRGGQHQGAPHAGHHRNTKMAKTLPAHGTASPEHRTVRLQPFYKCLHAAVVRPRRLSWPGRWPWRTSKGPWARCTRPLARWWTPWSCTA